VNQTLTVSVGSGVATGTYSLQVRATSGSLTKTASLSLTVTAPATDFSMVLESNTLTLAPGGIAYVRLTVTGSDGTLSLSLVDSNTFVCYLTQPLGCEKRGGAMLPNREHPLYYLDAETLLVAIYVWVDDELKALQTQGFKLPPKQRHQKATLAELLTLAIFLLLQGQDLAKGYLAAKTTLKAYFPSPTSPAFIGSCKRPRGCWLTWP